MKYPILRSGYQNDLAGGFSCPILILLPQSEMFFPANASYSRAYTCRTSKFDAEFGVLQIPLALWQSRYSLEVTLKRIQQFVRRTIGPRKQFWPLLDNDE
jgi:hypothetical protein